MRNFVTILFAVLLSSGFTAAQTKSRRAQKGSLTSATTAAPSSSDAEVDRIFQRFVEAQGDPRALSSVHSMVMRGIIEVPEYGMHGTVEVYAKEPDKKLT